MRDAPQVVEGVFDSVVLLVEVISKISQGRIYSDVFRETGLWGELGGIAEHLKDPGGCLLLLLLQQIQAVRE